MWVFIRQARTLAPVTTATLYWPHNGPNQWYCPYFSRGDGWYWLDISPHTQFRCSVSGFKQVTLNSGNCQPFSIDLEWNEPPPYRGWWGDGGSAGV